jgi:pyridinium-3,5-biscarboxylic acid mononucleotide sulfurtransferase
VQDYAAREGWQLRVVDAGEFEDENYRANPLNRCYFCKVNLYATIAQHTGWQIVSGANTSDLGEYRPGLIAAKEHHVRHPFVEAGIDKAGVRAIAHELGLEDLAELPSSPCLSSRVETGIRVEPQLLALVNDIEQRMRAELAPFKPLNLRCRIRANLVAIEVDADCLTQIGESERGRLVGLVAQRCAVHGVNSMVTFAPYRVGSAFLHERRAT